MEESDAESFLFFNHGFGEGVGFYVGFMFDWLFDWLIDASLCLVVGVGGLGREGWCLDFSYPRLAYTSYF